MVYLWAIYGLSVGCLWAIYGQSMVYLWAIYGKSMGNLWAIYGQSVGNLWAIYVYLCASEGRLERKRDEYLMAFTFSIVGPPLQKTSTIFLVVASLSRLTNLWMRLAECCATSGLRLLSERSVSWELVAFLRLSCCTRLGLADWTDVVAVAVVVVAVVVVRESRIWATDWSVIGGLATAAEERVRLAIPDGSLADGSLLFVVLVAFLRRVYVSIG